LRFAMQSTPNKKWATRVSERPFSQSIRH
jgi:hypothetical protein